MNGDAKPFVLDAGVLHLTVWRRRWPALRAAFSTRRGGVSQLPFDTLNLGLGTADAEQQVLTNRDRFLQNLAWRHPVYHVSQVHGTKVVTARGAADIEASARTPAGRRFISLGRADGVAAATPNTGLMAFFADCVPVFLAAPDRQVAAIVHAGWRGTVADMAGAAVRHLKAAFDLAPDEIEAVIGPAVGQCCYEVDRPVIDAVRRLFSDTAGILTGEKNGRACLDLTGANEKLLVRAGLDSGRIWQTDLCTSCRADLFFSHRRDGGATGRMAGFIGWTS
ncbi:MAG: peptidoglycan editing factor PgeF [Thermaerobacterales bacterium]